MTLYRFKTFKSTYYFPALSSRSRFIYSLYGNYGGRAAHLLWWLFTHLTAFRWLNKVEADSVEGFGHLSELIGRDAVIGINMGTEGPDQKKSVLGYERTTGNRFFAKLATKERAMALSRNEIKVYRLLADTGLVPQLFDWKDDKSFVYLKSECISGNHVHGKVDDRCILDILLTMKERHYEQPSSPNPQPSSLTTCFAHMDFCPWNMIETDKGLRVMDWEMAAEMPLGFDLFTYLLQTHYLIDDSLSGVEVIKNNEKLITDYFG